MPLENLYGWDGISTNSLSYKIYSKYNVEIDKMQ